jgi:hypothetical protein
VKKPVVGQNVYVVLPQDNNGYPKTNAGDGVVLKVGRKYFTVGITWRTPSEIQFDIESWLENSNFRPCRAYENREIYEEGQRRTRLWYSLRKILSAYVPPSYLCADDLQGILDKLRGDEPKGGA